MDAADVTDRVVTRRYRDPLEQVWLSCAARIGFRVERSAETFASSDGHGVIVVGTPETLDTDDCLAQMILHELCHALVEGPTGQGTPDWGLCNRTEQDLSREHACLIVQAALTTPVGLRHVLAPTTEHRAFFGGLHADPFEKADPEAVAAARIALDRAGRPPFDPHLRLALKATASLIRAALPFLDADSILSCWDGGGTVPEPSPLRPRSGSK